MIKNISIIKKSSITITAFRINNKICKMTVGNTSFLFEETIRKKYDITKKIYLGEAILIFLKIGNKIRKQQEKLIIQKLQTRISIWKLKNDRIVNNRKIIIYLKELKQYLLKNKNNYKAGEYKARFYLQNSNLSSNYILFGDRKLSQIVLQDKGITHTILSKYYNKQSIRYKLLDRVFINQKEKLIQRSSNHKWIKNRASRTFLNQLEIIINTAIADRKQKKIEVLISKERTLLFYRTFIWNQEVLWKKQVSINKNFLLNQEKLEKKQLVNTISFLTQQQKRKRVLNTSYLFEFISNYVLEKTRLWNPLQSTNQIFIKKQIDNTKLVLNQQTIQQQREKLIDSSNLIIVDNQLFFKRQTSSSNLLNRRSLLQQREKLLETIIARGQEFSKKKNRKEKPEQNNIVTVSKNWITIENQKSLPQQKEQLLENIETKRQELSKKGNRKEKSEQNNAVVISSNWNWITIENEKLIQRSSNHKWIKNRVSRTFLSQLEIITNTVIADRKQKKIEVLIPKERTLLFYPTFIWNQEVLWKKQVSINKNFLLNQEKLEKKQLVNTISFLTQQQKRKRVLNTSYLFEFISNYVLEKTRLWNPLQSTNQIFIKRQIDNTKLVLNQQTIQQQREKLIDSSNLIIVDNQLFFKRQTSSSNLLNRRSLLQQREKLLETIIARGQEFSKKKNRKEKPEQNNAVIVSKNWITIENQKSLPQQKEQLLENIETKRWELFKKGNRKEKSEQNDAVVISSNWNWIIIEKEKLIQKSSNPNWIKNRLSRTFLNQLAIITNTVIADKKQKKIEVLIPKERTFLFYRTFIWNQEVLWKKQVSINKNFLLNQEKLEKKQLVNILSFLTQQQKRKRVLNTSYLFEFISNYILEKTNLWNLLQSKNQVSIKRKISNAKLGNQKSLLQQKEKLIDSSNLIIVDNQLFFKRQTSNANLLNRKSLLQQKEKLLETIIAREQEFSKKSNRKEKPEQNNAVIVSKNWIIIENQKSLPQQKEQLLESIETKRQGLSKKSNRKEKSEQNNAVVVSSNWNWITIEKEKLIQRSSNHKWIKNRVSRTFLNQLETITNTIIADKKQKKIEVLIPKERTFLLYPTFIWNQAVLWKNQIFKKTRLWNLLQNKSELFIKKQDSNTKLVSNQKIIQQQRKLLSRKQGLLYNKNFKNSQVLLDKNISLQNNNSIHILNLFSIQNNPIITKQFSFLWYKQQSKLFAFYEKSDKEREKKDSIVLELRLEKEKQIEKETRKELEKKIEEKEIQLHTILEEIKQQKEQIKNLVKEQEQMKEIIKINSNITIKKWSKLVVNQFQEELQIEKIRYGLE